MPESISMVTGKLDNRFFFFFFKRESGHLIYQSMQL